MPPIAKSLRDPWFHGDQGGAVLALEAGGFFLGLFACRNAHAAAAGFNGHDAGEPQERLPPAWG
jgi:hypothetical protein